MSYRPARTLFGLIAVGGAIAVGVTTHDAGFTALTFVGGLFLPRLLGIRTHGPRAWACGGDNRQQVRSRFNSRMEEWHRQSHSDGPASSQATGGAAGA